MKDLPFFFLLSRGKIFLFLKGLVFAWLSRPSRLGLVVESGRVLPYIVCEYITSQGKKKEAETTKRHDSQERQESQKQSQW